MKQTLCIFFVLLGVYMQASFVSSDRIVWNKHRPIKWLDFEANPDYSDHLRDVVTASALNISTRCNPNGKLSIQTRAEFVKNQSWVKEVAKSDYHLGHEQLHFDATELYARKFRAKLSGREFACAEEPMIQEMIFEHLNELAKFQNEYDKSTKSSLRKDRQLEWEEFISNQLLELEQFASN